MSTSKQEQDVRIRISYYMACPSSLLSHHSDSHILTLRYGGDETAFTAAYDVTTVTALLEGIKAARTERGAIGSRLKKLKTARNAQGDIETGPSKKLTARNARGEIETQSSKKSKKAHISSS